MIARPGSASGLICITALALYLCACKSTPRAEWEQHAYIWSRSATPNQFSVPRDIRAVRVLVAQWSAMGDEPWVLKSAESEALSMGMPVIAVVRLDGATINVSATTVARSLKQDLFYEGVGTPPKAIEIDHDSATARLGDYIRWLREFRREWGDQSPIWITALPDWRRSGSLPELLDVVDTYTLQVHALDADSNELVDLQHSQEWIVEFERLSDTPYFVALPTYVTRVGKDEDRGVRFVESGSRVGASAANEQTLFVDPTDLASLASTLQTSRSSKRRGIAWFRLPSPEDRSTLSMNTFRALIVGDQLERKVAIDLVSVQSGSNTFDLGLHNTGAHDTGLPRSVELGEGCEAGDTSNGYRVAQDRRELIRTSQGLLGSGQTRPLGWIRCASSTPQAPTVQW